MPRKIEYRTVQGATLGALMGAVEQYKERNVVIAQLFPPGLTDGERWCALLMIDQREEGAGCHTSDLSPSNN